MNILGISGSPHENGNTAQAVRHALELARNTGASTRYISLANQKIHPCLGCLSCWHTGKCRETDDMESVLESLEWCQGLIIGSPVYFGLPTAQLKALMDRTVCRGKDRPRLLQGKIGGAIACGGFRNGGQELTLQAIHTFMMQWSMLVVSDGAPYCHSGATIAGQTRSDELGISTVSNLVQNIILMLSR